MVLIFKLFPATSRTLGDTTQRSTNCRSNLKTQFRNGFLCMGRRSDFIIMAFKHSAMAATDLVT